MGSILPQFLSSSSQNFLGIFPTVNIFKPHLGSSFLQVSYLSVPMPRKVHRLSRSLRSTFTKLTGIDSKKECNVKGESNSDQELFDNFSLVPVEILSEIFGNLDHKELSRASQVNREWNSESGRDDLWKKLFQSNSQSEECTLRVPFKLLEIEGPPDGKSWKWLVRCITVNLERECRCDSVGWFVSDVPKKHRVEDDNLYYMGDYVFYRKHGFGYESVSYEEIMGRPVLEYYVGQFYNGMREGHGHCRMTYDISGDVKSYVGDWKKGKREGKGIQILDSESHPIHYEGDFKNNESHGFGKLTFSELHHKYQGEFENGMLSGSGTLSFGYGGEYEGNFKDDDIYGKGRFTWEDGDYFEGIWDKRTRIGKIVKTNGEELDQIWTAEDRREIYRYPPLKNQI